MNVIQFTPKPRTVEPIKVKRRPKGIAAAEKLARKTELEERERQSDISNRVSGLIGAIIHLSELQGDPGVAIDELALDEGFHAHLVPVAEQAGRKCINGGAEKALDWLQRFVVAWREKFPTPDNVVRLEPK